MAEHWIRCVVQQPDGLFHIPASLFVIADQGLYEGSVPPEFRLFREGFNTGTASFQG